MIGENLSMSASNVIVLLLLHLSATAAMFGVIWLVQLVHYPMFLGIAEKDFQTWHEYHSRRISYLVAPLMIFELGSSLVLSVYDSSALNLIVLALTVSVWLSTFLLSVPLHNKLVKQGFDQSLISELVKTNWLRTVCYSVKLITMVIVITFSL